MTPSRSSPSLNRSDRVKFEDKITVIPRSPAKDEKTSEEEKKGSPSEGGPDRAEELSRRQRRRFRQRGNKRASQLTTKGKGKGEETKRSERDRSPTPHPVARKVSVQQ